MKHNTKKYYFDLNTPIEEAYAAESNNQWHEKEEIKEKIEFKIAQPDNYNVLMCVDNDNHIDINVDCVKTTGEKTFSNKIITAYGCVFVSGAEDAEDAIDYVKAVVDGFNEYKKTNNIETAPILTAKITDIEKIYNDQTQGWKKMIYDYNSDDVRSEVFEKLFARCSGDNPVGINEALAAINAPVDRQNEIVSQMANKLYPKNPNNMITQITVNNRKYDLYFKAKDNGTKHRVASSVDRCAAFMECLTQDEVDNLALTLPDIYNKINEKAELGGIHRDNNCVVSIDAEMAGHCFGKISISLNQPDSVTYAVEHMNPYTLNISNMDFETMYGNVFSDDYAYDLDLNAEALFNEIADRGYREKYVDTLVYKKICELCGAENVSMPSLDMSLLNSEQNEAGAAITEQL